MTDSNIPSCKTPYKYCYHNITYKLSQNVPHAVLLAILAQFVWCSRNKSYWLEVEMCGKARDAWLMSDGSIHVSTCSVNRTSCKGNMWININAIDWRQTAIATPSQGMEFASETIVFFSFLCGVLSHLKWQDTLHGEIHVNTEKGIYMSRCRGGSSSNHSRSVLPSLWLWSGHRPPFICFYRTPLYFHTTAIWKVKTQIAEACKQRCCTPGMAGLFARGG